MRSEGSVTAVEGRRLDVAFGERLDVAEWSRRHAAGAVPSRWPYGLHDLLSGEPHAVSVPKDSAVARARRALSSWRPGPPRTLLTWDENLFARVAPVPRATVSVCGVIWLTDADPVSSAVRRRARRLARADALFCLSAAQLVPLRELVGPGVTIRQVPFGVDSDFYALAPYPRRPLVVSAGGDRHRDAAALFAALEQVCKERPDADVVVQSRATLTPPPGVTVVDRMTHVELRDLYRRASVVVVATRPNLHVSGMTVALEAMATGRPVVISDTAGMDDYVRHDETGLVAPDVAGLAAGVLDLLGNRKRAEALGQAGRSLVEAKFTTAHLCAALDEVVEEAWRARAPG